MKHAAGVLLVAGDTGRVLLCRRVDTGEWATPGGMMEPDEYADETARRELEEETEYRGRLQLRFLETVSNSVLAYHLFLGDVSTEFDPVLNSEHSECRWVVLLEPPEPLHPGLVKALSNLLPELATAG